MDLQGTPLGRQLVVFATDAVAVSYRIQAELITPSKTIPVSLVTQLHTVRNYEQAVGDEVYLDLKFPPFQYQNEVLPYQQELKIRLIMSAYATMRSKADRVDDAATAYVYRAICLSTMDSVASSNDERTASNGERQDAEETIDLQFQLTDPVLDSFMQLDCGNNYYGTDVKNIMQVEFDRILRSVESDTGFKMRGVEIVDPNNQEPVKLLMLPHGTPAMDLADTIQNQVGVYSTDIGCYYQSPHLYLFPLYDDSRYETSPEVAIFYNFPGDKFPGMEKTWIQRTNFVEIACTRSALVADMSNTQTLYGGSGSRYTSASSVSNGMTISKDGETVIARSLNTSEFVTSDRQDGVKLAKGTGKVTDNRWRELSTTAARAGRTMMMSWEHANIDLLKPGMPCKVLWMDQNTYCEAMGVVLRADATITMAGSSYREPQYNCHGTVTLWLGPKEKDIRRPIA